MKNKIPVPKKKNKKGPGSPIPIDWSVVNSLREAGRSGVEIAAYFGVSEVTLYNRCKKIKISNDNDVIIEPLKITVLKYDRFIYR